MEIDQDIFSFEVARAAADADLYFEQAEQLLLPRAGVFFRSKRILLGLQLLNALASERATYAHQ